METSLAAELINTLGFPTAVCIALFWNNRETVKHYERILMEFKKTLENNTDAINQLNIRVKANNND